jgi:AcrR family transcriptional regulator
VVLPSSEKPVPGRPRDPAIDATVIAATRQLLEEAGFAGTTVQEISRRTGVHPPGIYRRWPSRIALIEDATFGDLATLSVDPTGDLAADLLRFVIAYEANFNTPACRAAMPGLLAAYGSQGEVTAERWVHLSVRPAFAAILAASDEVDPTLDIDAAFDVLLSLVLARVIIPPVWRAGRPIGHVVDILLRVIRPPSPGQWDFLKDR